MDLLPRHGVVFAVLLLARTAALTSRKGIDDWVRAAQSHGSYLAAATDLKSPARALLATGLASVGSEGTVRLGRPLAAVASASESRQAMRHAAVVLLATQPPAWLRVAVDTDGRVERAYIPQADLDALTWLQEALDHVLVEALRVLGDREEDDLSKAIGDAAEEVVVAALKAEGRKPVHVARISDAYGYDVEIPDEPTRFLEVKAAGPRSAERFHLSRHEFDTSVRCGDSWRIVQVVFEASAFVARRITATDVRELRELSASALQSVVPPDTSEFRWEKSAIVMPPFSLWRPSGLKPDVALDVPGFGVRAVETA